MSVNTINESQPVFVEDSKKKKFLKTFAAGAFSGTISICLFQPTDVVKTMMQKTIKNSESTGYMEIIKNIKHTDGIFGFWRGLSPGLLRAVPGIGLYFSMLHILNENVVSEKPTVLETMSVGAVSRTFGTICMNPLTVLKTRFESNDFQYRGILHAFKDIYATEGVRGLTRGMVATVMRDAPFAGLYYMFYVRSKELLGLNNVEDKSSVKVFSCGVTAGILASVVTQPADSLRACMQLYPAQFSRYSTGIIYIYQHLGMKGFFKGLYARLFRRTMVAAVSWTVYERVTGFLKLKAV